MTRTRTAAVALAVTAVTVAAACATSAWDRLPDVPSPRTESSAVTVGEEIWLVGGLAEDPVGSIGLRRVDVYDLTAQAWRAGPDLPIPLHHVGVVAVGRTIVVTGGYVVSPVFVPTASTWRLDTSVPSSEQEWEAFVPMPEPRGAHAAVTDGARIWVFGGVGPATNLSRTAFVLEPGADRWAPIAELPMARDHLTAAVVDGKIYAIGGRRLALGANTGRVDMFDPAAGTWTRRAEMRSQRGGIGSAVLHGRIVVIGGEASSGVFANVEAYDPASDSWESLEPLPTPRHGIGVAAAGDAIHVLAGGLVPGFSYSAAHERFTLAAP